ncbi:excinuclease ABC subunit UvrC [SAR202 cluster bacterium AD-804-J14_MRT_500m]|nr:excinuclease ABC subunit UvrC [SAR202 cluster bacterium AD-804-J14_MRT_500m]
MTTKVFAFSERLRVTPQKPGVYIMTDRHQKVLYVGKATNLRNRLRTYFGSPSRREPKISRLMSHMVDFEYIVTDSSGEALILENTLIKSHKPPFNARLKDDKTYPYIKIDQTEDFPQIYITRKVTGDGSAYFGPFATAGSIRKSMNLIKKLFPYRSCTKTITGNDPRPCLEYFINRCAAPCIGAITKDDYHKIIDQVILFMEGNTAPVITELRQKMLERSLNLEFEQAAVLRDQMRAIEQVAEEQRIKTGSTGSHHQDAIGMATLNDQACLEVFFIRHGKLTGHDAFVMDGTQDETPEKIVAGFVKQFYQSAPYLPRHILLQHAPEDSKEITEWLRKQRGGPVSISVPKRGSNRRMVDMAAENASQHLAQMKVKWWNNIDALHGALAELQEELNLPALPRRIECYDISNIQGSNPVGSMVTFEDGVSKKSHYRRFKIKQITGINDYAMMQEMLRRRLRRMTRAADLDLVHKSNSSSKLETASWTEVPDLVLIDGGKGHLSAALEVLLELGVDNVPLASIAKENEWIFVPRTPEPIILARNSPALHILQRVRDEAHRFAITFHRNLRSKSSVASAIDLITGIGPKKKRMLMRRFGSVRKIKEATLDEITAVPGMTRSLAVRLKHTL